jgi:putative ABC transport system permease protein
MFLHHLKIALRNLLKHRTYSFINIFGLAIGIAACLVLLQYVAFERSYDSFHEHGDQIYRVKTDYIRNGKVVFDAADNFAGVAPTLEREIPEIQASARLYNEGAKNNPVVKVANSDNSTKTFKEPRLFFADASFLKMFTFPLIKGNPETALIDPNTAVITEKTARRYFGREDPIGKSISLTNNNGDEHFCIITGVLKNVPAHSHLKFDLLISFKTLHQRDYERHEESWSGRDLYLTYIQLKEGIAPTSLATKIATIRDKYKPGYAVWEANGERLRINNFKLQPLQSIHLYSNFLNEVEPPGNPSIVNLLEIIAFFILIIAWVNYVNLTTARSIERAKEVGVRKVVGSSRGILMRQFFVEAFLYNLIAISIGILLVNLSKGGFENIIGKTLAIPIISTPKGLLLIGSILLIGTFVAGIYPAMVLSNYRPISVLSGNFKTSVKGSFLRKGLTIFQFAISVALIAGTMAIYYQIRYMQSQNLGFNQDQILVIKQPNLLDSTHFLRQNRLERIEMGLKQNPAVKQYTRSEVVPGNLNETGIVVSRIASSELENARVANFMYVDEHFIETYEMELLAGDYFRKSHPDSNAIILTESASAMLDFSNPNDAVNEYVYLYGRKPMLIRGVVKNYHQESLRKETNPTLFLIGPERSQYFSVRINSEDLGATISSIEKDFQAIFPDTPIDFFFLDEYFNRLYQDDLRYGQILAIFASFSIFIACLGLFGLTSFTIVQRTKEIGVRKVLGASVGQILILLSKNYVSLLLIASIIGLPIAYFLAEKWMSNYAHRIGIGWWFFLIPMIFMLFIALLSISYQSIQAALANPVKALKQD